MNTAAQQHEGAKSNDSNCVLSVQTKERAAHSSWTWLSNASRQHPSPGTRGKEVRLVSHSPAQPMNYSAKNKSQLLIFQDEQRKYQPGNCGWETVSGTEKFDAYSFPSLRTKNQEHVGIF